MTPMLSGGEWLEHSITVARFSVPGTIGAIVSSRVVAVIWVVSAQKHARILRLTITARANVHQISKRCVSSSYAKVLGTIVDAALDFDPDE